MSYDSYFPIIHNIITYLELFYVFCFVFRLPLLCVLCLMFKHELRTLLKHMSSPPVFSGVRVTRSLVLCVCFLDRCLSFCLFPFLLTIMLSVLLRFTNSGYPFGIFKLSLSVSLDCPIFIYCAFEFF